MTLDRGGDMRASTELLLAANGDITPTNHNGTNGSIITMTLKNNHLIVETEERNVSKAADEFLLGVCREHFHVLWTVKMIPHQQLTMNSLV